MEIVKLSPDEQKQILPLLGRCFPEYWEQLAAKEQKMPFDEISFAAYKNGILCGHCGVLPYEIADNTGIFRQMGGIASVAVAPEYRRQGIAAALCQAVYQWAETAAEMVSLPLYTGFFRVYQSVSWQLYPIPQARFARSYHQAEPLIWQAGTALDEEQKKHIISLYEASPVYPGKVRRKHGTGFHDWKRIFADPEMSFAVTDCGYAIKFDSALAEVFFAPGTTAKAKNLFFAAALTPNGCDILLPEAVTGNIELSCTAPHADPMHEERVLVRDLKNSSFHRNNPGLFFSLVDKF